MVQKLGFWFKRDFWCKAGTRVAGNYIGTDASGTKDLGSEYGVAAEGGSKSVIRGTTAAERNVISGNDQDGVLVAGTFGNIATGNRILQNSDFANGSLGIDLGDDGPTPNDPGDGDTGPNNRQNKPILSSARISATSTTVRGTLNSTPNKTFRVQIFSHPSGTDEGKTFIGTKSVTTDASGNVTFIFSPSQKLGVGKTVTATATGSEGTSAHREHLLWILSGRGFY